MNKLTWKKFLDKLTLLESHKEELKGRPKVEIITEDREQFTNFEFFKSNFFD